MYNVQVLMSTYNGEKYLREQIDSILNQKNVNVELLVRDDCSSDSTVDILKKYKSKVKWYSGKNLKPAKSFMDLIKNSGEFEYYAFSDQDDYWKSEKIISAIEKLADISPEIPGIYFCDKEIVNDKLETIKHKKRDYNISFKSALIKNVATGCTIVINNKMMKILKKYMPNYLEMHDSWIYRVCLSVGGKAIYDSNELIKYRQHGNNVIGAKETVKEKIFRRLNSFVKCKHVRENTAKELLRGYNDLIDDENRKILIALANYRKSLKNKFFLLLDKNMNTKNIKDDLIFKIAVIINRV